MESCREEAGQERRLWAGRGRPSQALGREHGPWLRLEKREGGGAAVSWWYHVLAVGPGRPRPPRAVLQMSRTRSFLLTGICCWLSNIPGLFWEPWGRGPPRVPRGPALLLGSWGLCPSLRNPPPHPPPAPSSWNVWLEIRNVVRGAGWGHRLVAGPLRPGRLCGEQTRQASGLPAKETMWGHCSSGGPPAPKPQSCLRPTGPPPPPPHPAPGAPSSLLRPPGPWHGRVSPPHNHIWFSLGSQDASACGPPLLGEVGRRIRGD